MISAIIVAGGKGKRMGQKISKQYIRIGEKEIIARTIEVFQKSKSIDDIVLVVPESDMDFCKNDIVNKYQFTKVKHVIPGGRERQESVYNGLKHCNTETELVLIHDGVRPFVDDDIIEKSIEAAREIGACTAAVPVKDTIKVIGEDGLSTETPDRSRLWAIQTPQAFKYRLILEAHKRALEEGFNGTDDTMLVEHIGYKVKVIEGSYNNIKITTPEDVVFAEAILSKE